jgi:hypothetical protein
MTFRAPGETLVAMSIGGTTAYRDVPDLPDLVRGAVSAATDAGFYLSCQPAQGRLTGLLVSIERDPDRAAVARRLFAADDRVTVLCGDWTELAAHGPFDLLVLDGGGQGKQAEPPLVPADWLTFGGTLVVDDFTPFTHWPPTHDGTPDTARLHWLTHPALLATELRLGPGLATIVARHLSPSA